MNVDVFFNKKEDKFYKELKEKVNSYFKDNNISIKGNMKMYLITAVLLTITYGSYFLILFGNFSEIVMLALVCVMGVGIAGIGMGIMHDGSHNAYSHSKFVNYIIGSLLNLAGSHKYIWDIRHNSLHHMYTNVYKYDYDMVKIFLVRHSPEAKKRWFHKYQHLYAPVMVYPYYTLFWLLIYDIFHMGVFSKFAEGEERKHPARKILGIIFWRLFYLFYIVVIPYMVLDLPFWEIMVGFLALHISTSLVLCTIFQVAHIMKETTHAIPDKKGNIKDTWAENQVKSSSNFSLNNKLLTWFCGGLNFQIEHHLFPWICSIHYPEIQPIVKATIEKYGMPYNVKPTLMSAYASHLGYLKILGNEK
ncbi:MAG: acyl-CoA desaturase [Spirochaetia bacterium]|nr:acyl-CoA desaturase [Spirochaetia bacterium]